MPAITGAPFEAFGLRFDRYVFACIGDEIPLHVHPYDHLAVVAHGRVAAFAEDGVREFEAPDVVMFRAGRRHGIRALTDGAVVLNVMQAPIGA